MALLEIAEADLLAWITGLLWPFVRIGALLVAAPLFGARTVSVRIRVALALLLAVVVFPLVPVPTDVDPLSLNGATLVLREVLIGVVMGFVLQMVFSAMAMAGELVALSMGLAFASMVDPDRGGSVPLVGQYFVIISTLLFLAMDGHLALLMLLMESFRLLPPATGGLAGAGFAELVGWGTEMFRAAVFVALPASASLLVANVSMGMIARSAPQLNIFAVGFPMTLMLGIVVLMLSLPALGGQFAEILTAGLGHGLSVLGAAR
jgi:flagellar biosynthetic protein FliR